VQNRFEYIHEACFRLSFDTSRTAPHAWTIPTSRPTIPIFLNCFMPLSLKAPHRILGKCCDPNR
jgi:hypothetical protein